MNIKFLKNSYFLIAYILFLTLILAPFIYSEREVNIVNSFYDSSDYVGFSSSDYFNQPFKNLIEFFFCDIADFV